MELTLDDALDYLYGFVNYETDASFSYTSLHYNLERTARLLELWGNPQDCVQCIHVAGTKGKGSVCAMVEALLAAGGHRTGRFTSPHLDRVNERIAACGRLVEDRELIELIGALPPLVGRFPASNQPTTFELLTAMALRYFRVKQVRYAVLECGMGGRFDATNVVHPLVAAITAVSYDHMDKLGSRIEQIAAEKAGIIKPGLPVVVAPQPYRVDDVFSRAAAELGSPLYQVAECCACDTVQLGESGTRFHANIAGTPFRDLFLPLPGAHQVHNALTALLIVQVAGLLPGEQAVRRALASVNLPARMEQRLLWGRRFLFDAAHNGDSARVLAAAVRGIYTYGRLITVVGIVKGKDERSILEQLAGVSDVLIVTEPVTHKELDTPGVLAAARRLRPECLLVRDIGRALRTAVEMSTARDLILVTGSFYTIAPARTYLQEHGVARGSV